MALNGSDLLARLYDRIGWSVVRGRLGSFANDMKIFVNVPKSGMELNANA